MECFVMNDAMRRKQKRKDMYGIEYNKRSARRAAYRTDDPFHGHVILVIVDRPRAHGHYLQIFYFLQIDRYVR